MVTPSLAPESCKLSKTVSTSMRPLNKITREVSSLMPKRRVPRMPTVALIMRICRLSRPGVVSPLVKVNAPRNTFADIECTASPASSKTKASISKFALAVKSKTERSFSLMRALDCAPVSTISPSSTIVPGLASSRSPSLFTMVTAPVAFSISPTLASAVLVVATNRQRVKKRRVILFIIATFG